MLVFAVSFRRRLHGVTGVIGGILTIAFAATVILTALRIDRSMLASSDPEQWNGWVHAFGALVGLLTALMAMIFVGLALRRDPKMRMQARISLIGPVAVIAAGFTPLGLAGSLLVVLTWFLVLGAGLYRSEAALAPAGA
jgi:energy-converting hydrogenase Eha subunit A